MARCADKAHTLLVGAKQPCEGHILSVDGADGMVDCEFVSEPLAYSQWALFTHPEIHVQGVETAISGTGSVIH